MGVRVQVNIGVGEVRVTCFLTAEFAENSEVLESRGEDLDSVRFGDSLCVLRVLERSGRFRKGLKMTN